MAEQLEIVIGANVDDAKAGINSLGQVINQFAQQGKLSIGVVEQSMAQLRAQIKVSSDPTEVAKLKEAYQALNQQLQQLKIGGGLESQLNGISRSTRLAHSDLDQMGRSLTEIASGNGNLIESLSRVAFSFEQLRGQTGSAKGAIAELGQVLTSPAGLLIAGAALAPLLADIGGKLLEMANGSRQAEEDLKTLTTQLKTSQEAIKGFNEDIDQAAVTRKLKIDIETPPGTDRTIKELNADLDAAQLKITNTIPAIKSYRDELDKLEASTKKVSEEQKDLHVGSLVFEQNKVTLENNAKQIELLKKQIQDANKELEKAQQDVINIPLKIQLINLDEARAEGKKQLQEFNRNLIERAKADAPFFEVPINLKFVIGDTSERELEKAKAILSGIEEHVIRLKVVVPDKIELPTLKPEVDKPFFKKQLEDLIKGFDIPIRAVLDEPSLLETEDQIKKVFSGFSDTNIFTEFGRNAGTKFREALLESVKIFDKGFTINPQIDVSDIIASLNASLGGIKDIELKVIKTETFDQAIRTLRDLHDAGVEAGNAVEKAFLAAGKSSEDAAAAGKAIEKSFGGITKQAADAAEAISTSLVSAVTDVVKAFASGQNPAKAFFDAIISSLEQVILKIIQAQIEQLILNTLFKAAAAAFNPLSILGLVGLEKGGDAPVDRPFIVGEKGPELMIAKTQMHVFSNQQSRSILSESIKEHESIKEYLIAEKVSQQVKEHFNTAFRSIESSVKILAVNNDRLAMYSYQLHNNIQSLKESFVSVNDKSSVNNIIEKLTQSVNEFKESSTDNKFEKLSQVVNQLRESSDKSTIQKLSESFNNLKESFASTSDKSVINNSIEKLAESVNNLKESSTFERLSNAISELKESFVSVTNDRLHQLASSKESFSDKSSVVEKLVQSFASASTITDQLNNTDSFEKIISLITCNSIEKQSSSNNIVNNYKESFDKVNTSIKETISYLTASINDKTATIDKSSHYETSFTASLKELQSLTASSIDRLHESVTNNNVTASIDKLHEKISERSDKSIHIERIINNNFFSSDLKESFKSMSISDLQRTFNIPAFASGGAVFGPTLAILGEGFGISRSNPEFVGTRSQLSGIQGGQFDVNVNVNGELSFSMGKLAIALNREQRSSFRTNGKSPF